MKIYTGTGDGGKTSLFSGERISKSDSRIDAYGDVDELSSWIGVVIAHLTPETESLKEELQQIQTELFEVGAWLATMPGSSLSEQLEPLTLLPAQRLEETIDQWDQTLSALNAFILPGGYKAAAFSHLARTVCRRAERHVVQLLKESMGSKEAQAGIQPIVIYLNRLSDYFFVIARYINARMNVKDIPWKK